MAKAEDYAGRYKVGMWLYPHKEETRFLQCVDFSQEAGGMRGQGMVSSGQGLSKQRFCLHHRESLDRTEIANLKRRP